MRDKLQTESYWKNKIDKYNDMLLEMEEKLQNVSSDRIIPTKQYIELKRLELMISMYSAGANLDECKKLYIINLNNLSECKNQFESYVDLIWYISLGVLFKINEEEVEQLERMISQKFSDDKLVCYLMKYLKDNYQDGKTYFMKNPYENLDILISSDVYNLGDYMNNYLTKWYKAHSFESWYNSHNREDNLYFGYWSFELGAIIKIKGLNNEEFKDINYYPYDLVEYK